MNSFTLNGRCSADFGMIMTEPPKIILAEPDVETVSVPGRSGDLLISKNRYKNITKTYKCAIIPEGTKTLREAVTAAMTLLMPSAEYARLENTYHPESFRLGRIASELSIESIVEQAGSFSVQFDCKPQRFLFSGLETIAFEAPGELQNAYFPSLPLITVYGTGDGTVAVGDTVVGIVGQTDTIVLDCDLQNAYHENAVGVKENRNSCISAPVFPTLLPGSNTIGWTGGVERLEIIPRWWTL